MRGRADSELDDVELMRRLKGGDDHAFDVLVRRHMAFVVRHARRYLGVDPCAEDVAQEVFLRLYRSAELFRDARSFRGWLATITSRLALNELRTRKRKRWVPRSTLDAEHSGVEWRPGGGARGVHAVEHEHPEGALMRAERNHAVQEAILQLPERQREAIWLQRFEGWDLDHVGAALGLTVPAVKSLLHRARASLEKLLAPYMKEPAGGEQAAASRESSPAPGPGSEVLPLSELTEGSPRSSIDGRSS